MALFPTLGPQQPCVFCLCLDKNTKNFGVAQLEDKSADYYFQADVHACFDCEAQLWNEHEKTVGHYRVNYKPTKEWWGSKKMRLDHASGSMLTRKRCETFYSFVVERFTEILECRQFTPWGPMRSRRHLDRGCCPYQR